MCVNNSNFFVISNGTSCPWGELSWGELSMGRVVHGASCFWGKLSMGRVVHGVSCPWGELTMGRVVYGASCRGASFDGASCPWGELSWGEWSGNRWSSWLPDWPEVKYLEEIHVFLTKRHRIMSLKVRLLKCCFRPSFCQKVRVI